MHAAVGRFFEVLRGDFQLFFSTCVLCISLVSFSADQLRYTTDFWPENLPRFQLQRRGWLLLAFPKTCFIAFLRVEHSIRRSHNSFERAFKWNALASNYSIHVTTHSAGDWFVVDDPVRSVEASIISYFFVRTSDHKSVACPLFLVGIVLRWALSYRASSRVEIRWLTFVILLRLACRPTMLIEDVD